jgi:hypothetical protein
MLAGHPNSVLKFFARHRDHAPVAIGMPARPIDQKERGEATPPMYSDRVGDVLGEIPVIKPGCEFVDARQPPTAG